MPYRPGFTPFWFCPQCKQTGQHTSLCPTLRAEREQQATLNSYLDRLYCQVEE